MNINEHTSTTGFPNNDPIAPGATDSTPRAAGGAMGQRGGVWRSWHEEDDGMTTIEYAMGSLAAAALAATLYAVVSGGKISKALTDIVMQALNSVS